MNAKLKPLLGALALTLSVGHAQAATAPAPIFNSANGHYYAAIDTVSGYNWHDAKANAESMIFNGMRGHLATITSAAENQWIFDNITNRNYYLGGTDENSEGNWEWVTGEAWDFTNWSPGEPNNCCVNGEHYLQFWHGNGSWNDIFNNSGHVSGYIVEFDNLSPVPVPAAGILFGSALAGLFGFRRFSKKAQKA